jgi:hypothetical protein
MIWAKKKLTAYKLLDAKIRQSTPITKREEFSRELGPEVCRRKRHRDSDERTQKNAHLSGTRSPPLLALNLAVSAGGAIMFVNAVVIVRSL